MHAPGEECFLVYAKLAALLLEGSEPAHAMKQVCARVAFVCVCVCVCVRACACACVCVCLALSRKRLPVFADVAMGVVEIRLLLACPLSLECFCHSCACACLGAVTRGNVCQVMARVATEAARRRMHPLPALSRASSHGRGRADLLDTVNLGARRRGEGGGARTARGIAGALHSYVPCIRRRAVVACWCSVRVCLTARRWDQAQPTAAALPT
jgi:hypothetical protein